MVQKVVLGCMLAGIAAVKAQDMGRSVDCTVAYTGAYMSTLNGECSLLGCTPNCQAKINAVRTKQLYPRALLTPFTDNVDLTEADQRAYLDAVNSQRFKGFQSVTVRYEDDGQRATARNATKEPVGEQTPSVEP